VIRMSGVDSSISRQSTDEGINVRDLCLILVSTTRGKFIEGTVKGVSYFTYDNATNIDHFRIETPSSQTFDVLLEVLLEKDSVKEGDCLWLIGRTTPCHPFRNLCLQTKVIINPESKTFMTYNVGHSGSVQTFQQARPSDWRAFSNIQRVGSKIEDFMEVIHVIKTLREITLDRKREETASCIEAVHSGIISGLIEIVSHDKITQDTMNVLDKCNESINILMANKKRQSHFCPCLLLIFFL